MTDACTCPTGPRVWVERHRTGPLVAWHWPGGPMFVQPPGGAPVQVTSEEFAVNVELGWFQLVVDSGVRSIRVMDEDEQPVDVELVRS